MQMVSVKSDIRKDRGFSLITLNNYIDLQNPKEDIKTSLKAGKKQGKYRESYTNNNVIMKERKNILRYYIALKSYAPPFDKSFYSRNYKAIASLQSISKSEAKIKQSLDWTAKKYPEMWTLETCVKKFPDFLASQKTDTDSGGWAL